MEYCCQCECQSRLKKLRAILKRVRGIVEWSRVLSMEVTVGDCMLDKGLLRVLSSSNSHFIILRIVKLKFKYHLNFKQRNAIERHKLINEYHKW